MAKKVTLDLAAAKQPSGKTQQPFTAEWLIAQGVTPAQAKSAVADYNAQPTTGLKSSYRKRIQGQLGIAPTPQEIAQKASNTRKGKQGNGKGSQARSDAAKKAAATRKRNGN